MTAISKQAPSGTVTRALKNPSTRVGKRSRVATAWYLVLPAALLYLFVVLVPSGQGAYFAFTDWNGLSASPAWVGLDNFTAILDDPLSRGAVLHTVVLTVALALFQNVIGLALALGVHANIKSRNVLRLLFFVPAIVPPVIVAYLWQYILAPQGALNQTLGALGLEDQRQSWLGDSNLAFISIIVVAVWQFSGYSMIIFLAGLTAIPEETLEAAALDGAGAWARLRHVVLPLLAPSITINLVLAVINGLKLFDQVWVMTGGGPGGATETLSTLIYRKAFQFSDFGASTALAIVLTILIGAVSFVQFKSLSRKEG